MGKFISLFAILLLQSSLSWSQKAIPMAFNAAKITAAQLPKTLRFKGKPVEVYKWTDGLGENILITASFGPYADKPKDDIGDPASTVELYAFHYIKKDTAYKLLWKTTDAEKACQFDLTAQFIKASLMITDLDNDNIAETTVQYKLVCRSDVSPAYMKLIMHEDSVKYALRGFMWVQASAEEKFTVTEKDMNLEKLPKKSDEIEQLFQSYGRYETEKEFKNAPPSFLEFAKKQWFKFVIEKFE